MFAMLGVATNANAAALTWSADTTIDLADDITILSGSEATSLVVGTTNIQVVVASGDEFTVTSVNTDFSVTGNTTSIVTESCTDADVAYVTITGGADGETITISPSGAISCTSGGGGGGGSSNNNDNAATPAVPANEETPAGCLPGYQFSPLTGRNCNAATPAVPTVCPQGHLFSGTTGQACTSFTPPGLAVAQAAGGNAYAFGNTLVREGSKGGACLAWQTFLNAHGASLATDGACGRLTMAAARAWQGANGLVADGLLGPMSRAKANTQ